MRTPMPVTTPAHGIALDDEIGNRLLEQREPGRALQHPHGCGDGRAHGRSGRGSPAPRGPLRALRVRKWIPQWSAPTAIAPPSASISLTRCPLPIPPMAGLQLICPSVSMLCVSSSVSAPARAAASAASVPAWPPPTTMTSNVRE